MNHLQWKEWWRNERLSKKEVWKDIPGREGLYRVSNMGRVQSIKSGIWKFLGQGTSGYCIVGICCNGYVQSIQVHRLVAQSFIENPDNKSQVNHINGIKYDNRVENLEWCTASENTRHAWGAGLNKITPNNSFVRNHPTRGKFGALHHNVKRVAQYLNGQHIKTWHGTREVARVTGIKQSNISDCCLGRQKTAGGFTWVYV